MIGLFYKYDKNGPGKVIKNLINGLERIGQEYFLNEEEKVNEDSFVVCLQEHPVLYSKKINNLIIGPNICTLPIDVDFVMKQKYNKILVPSQWVFDKYKRWINTDKIKIWASGVDTDFFQDFSKEKKTNDCLIYFKRRNYEDLVYITKFLKNKNQSFEIIEYGNYTEEYFLNLIKKSKYAFIIDSCESQGIAIQEMMSCNLPLFVWDVEFWNDRGEEYKVSATSIPYWNEICGIKETNRDLIFENFNLFLDKKEIFKPREFVLKNFNLEKQASDLLKAI
jgi:hypothetical protein